METPMCQVFNINGHETQIPLPGDGSGWKVTRLVVEYEANCRTSRFEWRDKSEEAATDE